MSSLILNRPWSFRKPKENLISELSRRLSFPRSLTAFLINRGLESKEAIEDHLTPTLSRLTDPFFMKDMDRAVDRLVRAVVNKERIGIFGDFDADGVTACALVSLFLQELGLETFHYIPHRENEGYGLNQSGIDWFASKGCKLMVTVDCGITNVEEVRYAASLGIDVIVTDHHQPHEFLPDAVACVDPKRADCAFPFKELSGVGVAFYLSWALRRSLHSMGFFKASPPNLKKYLDLVAVGTVADMMPLYMENRILVSAGLQVLSDSPRPGMKALMESTGLSGSVSSLDLAFRIGPRLNAAGRVHHADTAFNLLVSKEYSRALELAKELHEYNQKRQKQERQLLSEVLEIIKHKGERAVHVLYGNDWRKGILGLVASKAVEYANCPVILLAKDGDTLTGSGRAPEEVDLFSAISSCHDLFLRFGGHRSAAGVKLPFKKIDEFIQRFEKAVLEQLSRAIQPVALKLDAEVNLTELATGSYLQILEQLEPFGPGYEPPLFSTRNFVVHGAKIVGQNHLKISIQSAETTGRNPCLELLAWGHGDKVDISWNGVELAFTPSVNKWNGRKSVQLILKDARKS